MQHADTTPNVEEEAEEEERSGEIPNSKLLRKMTGGKKGIKKL